MYAIQSKPKNNVTASWNMCYDVICEDGCNSKTCPCAFFFRGDAEMELVKRIVRDEANQYRIMPCTIGSY